MEESTYPNGIDRWFFSQNWCEDHEFAYTSRSLAGQWFAESDSWGPNSNPSVGDMEEPPSEETIYLRYMSHDDLPMSRRRVWKKHLSRDRGSRKHGKFGSAAALARWSKAPPSMRPVPPPKAKAVSLAGAVPKSQATRSMSRRDAEAKAATMSSDDIWQLLDHTECQ